MYNIFLLDEEITEDGNIIQTIQDGALTRIFITTPDGNEYEQFVPQLSQ